MSQSANTTDTTQEKINTKAHTMLKFTIVNALLKIRPNKNRKKLNYHT